MTVFTWLRTAFSPSAALHPPDSPSRTGAPSPGRDGVALLQELSRLLSRDGSDSPLSSTEAADVPLALGTLFRTQGDIDQAVAVRECLLTFTDLPLTVRARTWFELGRDYRAAGLLDRSVAAYKEARKLGHPDTQTSTDLARLYADAREFASAASEAARLEMPEALACYLVREAEERASAQDDDAAARLLKKALAVYPGSPEAGLARVSIQLLGGAPMKALEHLRSTLDETSPSGRLILLEGLYALLKGESRQAIPESCLGEFVLGLNEQLTRLEPDVTLCYYGGLFLQLLQREAEAEQWFTKALVLDSDFWAARLALVSILAAREQLPPLLAQQVTFFSEQGALSKRFLCRPCGMRRDTIFSECPRCRAWHSVAFRLRLN